ncbi:CoA-acylating methylmalonate-semialdehyde dehydrogenase [Corynebacterium felinum]|uniref:methylmalonate-semialdehyde dehydrogenase (CoA acylating) n=1 Tax=Corynebacterium felinum TaxID=131318 RepID=A0ABU2BCG2_9CORY|nr:CoA-acylating methylmalonate-semialdehyde dehydrogenase [Corynebacterium felinum]MDF5820402.1 CoA-acylating methylmalonate-semialdehyde dehydrogenase [Corynebacterium felinum]MDR7355438.1 malonate-semialdehyde dehydrogenase (acetylating)/methylmalonate-semialdehyde dehydrogenase [Corynebacterium felinum]WJY94789.1 Methylmalonate-semialdehyde dehydrogenase [acylating] [Corynebacterium felinum]
MTREVHHYINGAIVQGTSGRFGDVYNPALGAVQAKVALATREEVTTAIDAAQAAQPAWAALNPQRRARILGKFVDLIRANMDELASLLSSEHGKVLADARGDIERGLDVLEFSMGAPHLLKGENSDSVGSGIDTYSMRQPLGVVAGITPFNFPAMIPLWKLGPAVASGNAFILKPSERCPSVPFRLAELATEAGFPAGIVQVVNGDRTAVDALLEDPRVRAYGFVGSTPIAQSIYARAAELGKRAQCFGGAKNHCVIMPDADLDQVADALVGAAYGSAGERCMALSVALPVGKETADRLVEKLTERIAPLKVGAWDNPDADYGPLVGRDAYERVRSYIDQGVEAGADLLVDGRDLVVEGYESGFFIGPSLFDNVTKDMSIYTDEIFGPVLCIVRCADYEEALALVNDHEYGNGVAIMTNNGGAARDFAHRVQVGMVGINVPIPVPIGYYTFGGWKASSFGDLNQHGPDAFRFYTKTKTVTERWPSEPSTGAKFIMPLGDQS